MEQWRDITDFEGCYQISNLGNVRSLDRVNHQNHFYKGKPKAVNKDHKGYNIITLYKDGSNRTFKVHRLVALAFIPNSENKPEVNHIDGNKINNRMENLEWCTPSENQKHAFAMGLQETYKGDAHIKSKLTNQQAGAIRYLRNDNPKFYTLENLANMYSVSIATISLLLNNKRYKGSKL